MPAPLQDGTGLLGGPQTTLFAWLVSFTCDKFGHTGAVLFSGEGYYHSGKGYYYSSEGYGQKLSHA